MTQKNVVAVILAAGRSSRLGTPKQLLEIEGKTLLRRTVETVMASKISAGGTSVVLGARGRQCSRQIQDLPCIRIPNDHWKEGISTSIRKGLKYWQVRHELIPPDEGITLTRAVLFVPCDLPFLSTEHIDALLEAHVKNDAPLIVSEFDGVLGSPALFTESLWAKLLELEGDEGARKIINQHRNEAVSVPFEGGQFDLDTPGDVEAFRRNFLPALSTPTK